MRKEKFQYDAIVVGAGHAGVEAALSIARAGHTTLLLSLSIDTISKMSCNPAIGGLAKGHIVREIDALGGEMGKATDATGIQFRMLNMSKGPAVWAPRAQCDKQQYSAYMKRVVLAQKNLVFQKAAVDEIVVENQQAVGVKIHGGEIIFGKNIIITTGTFLKGLIHIGQTRYAGGRGGEPAGEHLSQSLKHHGLTIRRFKTGTPPRLWHSSIRWETLDEQPGDLTPRPFSFQTQTIKQPQISCHMTYTNEQTHQIIRDNLHRSPLYGGIIQGIGPRYCPSIEDKVVRFEQRTMHQIYLEPEGLSTQEVYVNGLSTSLPQDIQLQILRSMKGLENCDVARWGYAIEYDYCPPTQLHPWLETKTIHNLFLAGQINATSGYEEAAAQGLMAGLNVIRRLRNQTPFILERSEAYIGVLLDDLVTKGTNEPYRMFTSRAEFRLLLRQDNADARLMKYGYEFGLIPQEQFLAFEKKRDRIKRELQRLETTFDQGVSLLRRLRNPEVKYVNLKDINKELTADLVEQIEIEVKYEGYVARQQRQINQFRKMESKRIPGAINYACIRGLSSEASEKLGKIRPISIGQAARIPGVTPCDVSLLSVYLRKEFPASV